MLPFKYDICVLDTETTGLEVARHEIIEIAAVKLHRASLEKLSEFSSLVKPQNWAIRDPEAEVKHKITLADLESAPSWTEVYEKLVEWLSGPNIFAAYNGWLDFALLRKHCLEIHQPLPFDYHGLDVWPMCFSFMQSKNKLTNPAIFHGFTMEDVCQELGVPIEPGRHRALGDARMTASLFRELYFKQTWQE